MIGRRWLHTLKDRRQVRLTNFHMNETHAFPTLGDGLHFDQSIFGLHWREQDVLGVQSHLWQNGSFVPTQPAAPLTGDLGILSDVGSQMAVQLKNGEPGLLARNQLRSTLRDALQPEMFDQVMGVLEDFQQAKENSVDQKALAQTLSDLAFWCQWLIRGHLFEGKLHGQQFTEAVVGAPLSQMAVALNAAIGRHQMEFVYDDYTLKAATFPKMEVNYEDPQSIIQYIRNIQTPVGWGSMQGGSPEHNFRHNHSLMERQMEGAFEGWRQIQEGRLVEGYSQIADAAERAHQVFRTMMVDTPPHSYPMVRLPIKGVRGALGSVYPPHGVFYELCGSDTHPNLTGPGMFVDREFGQTGANSSMYKWFDIFVGVSHDRGAYSLNARQKAKMAGVYTQDMDPGLLGDDPIDSMQRAFDLLTRPIRHLKTLASTDLAVREMGLLKEDDPELLYHRLRLAFSVSSHRIFHAQYVYQMIYQTQPVGGMSRAMGTGGSTPPFLKTFVDQTLSSARGLLKKLSNPLLEHRANIREMAEALDHKEKIMGQIHEKGLSLEKEEEETGKS